MTGITPYLKRPFFIVLALFLLSVMVRLPQLNRPLSKHHEYITAHMLINLESWHSKGISHFKGIPLLMYPEKYTQKYYKKQNHSQADAEGNMYYTSFPPFAFYLPYFLFSLLGIPFTPLSLQMLNLLFHGLSAWLIYLIFRNLTTGDPDKIKLGGLSASAIYLFMPAPLWFFCNTYFADIFCVNLFVIYLYFLFRMLKTDSGINWKTLLPFGLSLFLLAYTEWIGFIAGVITGASAFYFAKAGTQWKMISLISITAILSAGILIFWQFSQINGLDAYLYSLKSRLMERGFADPETENFGLSILKYIKKWRFLFMHYATGFLPVLLLLIPLIPLRNKWREAGQLIKKKKFIAFILLAFVPFLIHHALLIRYSIFHDFSVLKTAPFIALCAGWLVFRLSQTKTVFIFLGLAILTGIIQFQYINRPGEVSLNGDRYESMKNIGLHIRQNSHPDEILFLSGIQGSPQISYYAGRNLFYAPDSTEAIRIMRQTSAEKGRLFESENAKIKNEIPLKLMQAQ